MVRRRHLRLCLLHRVVAIATQVYPLDLAPKRARDGQELAFNRKDTR